METYKAIMTRRSVRKYQKGKPVSEENIIKLLRAAMAAPSAGNQQPWHFVVIDDRTILEEIPKVHPFSMMLKEASIAILVCADENLETKKGYFPLDCSAATQNILLAAHDMGLGAVWLGIYPREDRMEGLKELIATPEGVIPFSLIAIGYPSEKLPSVDRFDEKRIHKNKWSMK